MWIDCQFEFFRQFADLSGSGVDVKSNGIAWFSTKNNVLGYRHRVDQHEVLMDHPDAEGNSVMWGVDLLTLTVNQDLAFIGCIEAVGDPHGGRLTGAILTHNGVNGSGLNFDIDVIVG